MTEGLARGEGEKPQRASPPAAAARARLFLRRRESREKLGGLAGTNRTLASKQLEYFAVILARIQKRHKAKLGAVVEEKERSEEACAAKERLLEQASADLETAATEKAALERSLRQDVADAQARYQQELEELAARSDEALRIGLERQEGDLTQRHQDAMRTLVESHADELERVRESEAALQGVQERERQERKKTVDRLAEALAAAEGRLSERASEGTEERDASKSSTACSSKSSRRATLWPRPRTSQAVGASRICRL